MRNMMNTRVSTVLMSVVAMATIGTMTAACSSGGGGGNGQTTGTDGTDGTDGNQTSFSGLAGKVTTTDGVPVSGVSIIVDGESAQSAEDGTWKLKVATGDYSVAFIEDGFATVYKKARVLDTGVTWVDAMLKTRGVRDTFDNAAGGTVADSSGATVTFPADALAMADGQPFTGTVVVDVTYFNPESADLMASPVPLDSADMDGEAVVLESFGMIDVELEDEQGNKLEVADGKTADLVFPVPAGLTEPPATIPLWHGITTTWRHRGEATYDAEAKVYRATVNSFSTWNIDKVAEATCIRGLAKDSDGNPVAGAFVFVEGQDYSGSSSTTAEADGRFCVVVRKNSQVKVTVYGYDGVGVAREVESWEKDTPIPPPCDEPEQVEEVCKDTGEWVVSSDAGGTTIPDGGTGVAACAALGSYDPCLDGLLAIYQCWNPEGSCEVDLNLMGVVWANGASLTGNAMKNASGTLCGSLQTDTELAGISNPQGQSWSFEPLENGTRVTCPNGTKVDMTDTQGEAAKECFGTGTNTSACTNDLQQGGPCSGPSDCSGGQVCCEYTAEVKYCVPEVACPQM